MIKKYIIHKFNNGWFKKGYIPPLVKKGRIFINCGFCHNKFKTTKWEIKRGKKYCSFNCYNESRKGIGNHNWKGGIIFRNKYWRKRVIGHPRANKTSPYVKLAVLNMERKIGRYLFKNEIVHHINGNKLDDKVENLMLLQSNKEHRKLHYSIS